MPRYSAPMTVKKPQVISAASFEDTIKGLPLRRNYQKAWHPTQFSPCPLLMQCSKCKEYLPATDFYVKTVPQISRQDILGQNHVGTCVSCNRSVFPSIDPCRKLYYSAKSRAAKKGLEFNITVDDIVIPKRCPVLGITLKAGVGGGTVSVAKLESSPTLDRIDNSRGYTPDNICVISLRANNLKRDASLYELRCLAYNMSKPCNYSIVNHGPLMNEITAKATKSINCSSSMKDYYRKDHRKKLLSALQRRGKTYGYDGSINAEDIIIPQYCPVLGIELFPSVGKGVKTLDNFYHSPSIDRINNHKGYTKENIQIISFRANCLKRDASLWEVRALVGYMESSGIVSNTPTLFHNDTNQPEEV
jgi:hypothetical protein